MNLKSKAFYREKLSTNLFICFKHLERVENAFSELSKEFSFPIDKNSFQKILNSNQYLAYSDQIIYRFSKLQDSIGAKLFKYLSKINSVF